MNVLERLRVASCDLRARFSQLLGVEHERRFVERSRFDGARHVDHEPFALVLDASVALGDVVDQRDELFVLIGIEIEIGDGVGDHEDDADLGRRYARGGCLVHRCRRGHVEMRDRSAARGHDRREHD